MVARSQVKSVCPYCGVGCGIVLQVEDGRVTKIAGDKTHPANFGRLCTKGSTAAEALVNSGRMETAFIRPNRCNEQMPVPMDEAIDTAANRLRGIIDAHGPDAVALYVSGQMSLEAQYLANKLAKGFIRTNNIDSNSRLCMSSAASGYKLSLGADGPPGSYQDFDAANLFFVIGSNMAECHPILFLRLLDRKKSGTKLIVVDPRRTPTAEKADLFLQLKPGSDLALLNGILHLLVEAGDIDAEFIAAHTEGWDDMSVFLREFSPAQVAAATGLHEADIRTAARWIGAAKNWMSCWTMGLNQSTQGTWHTNAICNLHLATGAICRIGAGPFSLTGQPNAMGGREVGYLSHGLPGQRTVANQRDRDFIEKIWNIPEGSIQPAVGTDAVSMFEGLESGAIKAVWIICTNPVASMPNRAKVIAGLRAAELVITQDAFLDTETNAYADILFPGALWAEGSGVMINSERNMTLMRQAVAPTGEARPDWQIIAQVACAMGYKEGFSYSSAAEVFDEIRHTSNPETGYDISGATHETLSHEPQQWPIAPQGNSRNPVRYRGKELRFPTQNGRARFFARPALQPDELPNADYPFVLNTGRVAHQWHTMTKTGKIKALIKLNPGPFIEINPEDAAELGLQMVDQLEIISRRGRAVLPAVVTRRVLPGNCFVPFHWNDVFGDDIAINAVTSDAVDAASRQPEFKFCAVTLTKSPIQSFESQKENEMKTHLATENPFAAFLELPTQPPSLDAAEALYVSGFFSGLNTPGALSGVPVLPEAAPLSPLARLWIDGVLAGLFSRVEKNPIPQAAAPTAAQSVTLLWASQTGNSEALAERLKNGLEAAGILAQAACMADYPVGDLGGSQNILLISSTYGDGEPPDNGRGFWDFLCEEMTPRLEHLNFAVCGLGDSSYDQFCQHGKNLDTRLAELGAQRLVSRLDCDADHEPEIDAWLNRVTKRLNGVPSSQPTVQPVAHGKNHPYLSQVLGNTRLNQEDSGKDTRFISLSLANSNLHYQAGDVLGVWPTNCPDLVDEVLACAGLSDDAMVTVDKAGNLPLRKALQENFELTRVNRETLEFVAERSGSPELKALLGNNRKNDLKQFLWGKQLPDVLREFSIRTNAQEFVRVLKHIQPRLYSIASSPIQYPDEVHLTVSAVNFGARHRKGVCSGFLAGRADACDVPIFVQPTSHFHLPKDTDTPIIMIGPGTGIAPFRAFLQERRALGARGRNWLFFGERNRTTDFYYEAELTKMHTEGFLTELSLAFSRDQAEKIYVQRRIIEQGAALWAWLQDGAFLYVCGDAANMAKDVEAAIVSVIEQHGGLTHDTAQDYLKSLTREKRYLRDVY
ncbi:MAG: molybdopterin-dependent oxidoreductase [Rhodospirillales bacterium]|nr:molybdopterin-dependent oxidoreductase [Rhodospirillales bacterium]